MLPLLLFFLRLLNLLFETLTNFEFHPVFVGLHNRRVLGEIHFDVEPFGAVIVDFKYLPVNTAFTSIAHDLVSYLLVHLLLLLNQLLRVIDNELN